jgi:predicted nucleic acid-binding protein
VPVLDASVFVDALVGVGTHGQRARRELLDVSVLQVPAIFGAEAASALRALIARGELDPIRATAAIEQIRTARMLQYPFEPFCRRVWELRANLSIYDAWYVALAEQLGTELVTADERLLRAVGPRCPIRGPAP